MWQFLRDDAMGYAKVSLHGSDDCPAHVAAASAVCFNWAVMTNALYYGDNLDILREHVPDESVDLVYLDPPFNSNASYNVLFREQTGEGSPAQIKAFTDTWEWTQESQRTFENEIMLNPSTPANVREMVNAFRQFIGSNAMMAYLVMMTPRLVELRRVLKPTGSIYLHCDPTAGHYLKVLMDAIFGKENFRNEIVWKRTGAHGGSKRWGPIHDIILFYSKSDGYEWKRTYQEYESSYVEEYYRFEDEKGRYQLVSLTGAGIRSGDSGRPWLGVNPTDSGRHWAVPIATLQRTFSDVDLSDLSTQEKLDLLNQAGLVYWPERGSIPRQKRYLEEGSGVPIQDIINDIPPIGAHAKERLGYPTQKPEALLERIIEASSNEGGVVLDPFCGCGTAIAAAQKLNRQWMGIDITHLAVALMKNRLKTAFEILPGQDYRVVGEPVDVGGARALAEQDRYQFEFWAMSLLEAFPREQKKRGADQGVDGVVYFIDGPRRTVNKAIVQVKSGRVSSPLIRDLVGTVEREKAAIGLFITLEEPTRDMRTEAVSAGFYHSDLWQTDYPKIQIRTVGELLEGKGFEVPRHPQTYQASQRITRAEGEQPRLDEAAAGG